MTKILDQSRPKVSVLDFSLDEIVKLLRKNLSLIQLDEVYLFGSVLTKNVSAWSDVDLLIVMQTELPFLERPRQFAETLDLGFPVDILVYTPAEFSRLRTSDSGFWKSFRDNNRKII